MARILYGVQGDTGGHVTRSLSIARQLAGHEIVFVGGDRVASLRRAGFDTVDVPMLATVVTDGHIDLPGTAIAGLRTVVNRTTTLDMLDRVIADFDPDLILADYEYFTPRAARRAGRPCISVDRQHFLTHCDYPVPPGDRISRALTLGAIRAFQMEASKYFVVSFTPTLAKNPATTEAFPPVLRQDIIPLSATCGEDALLYLYAVPIAWIRQTFGGTRRRFIVYGHDRDIEEGNLTFRRHDVGRFADDLARASYVVSHAGNNLISEALHLGKPLLTFPIGMNYEQYLNSHLLADAGYGMVGDMRNGPAILAAFEASLAQMRSALAGYRPWSDRSVAGRIAGLLPG